MASNDTCHQAGEGRRSSFHILAITGLATIALGSLFSFTMFSRHPKILRSPLKTVIPTLSSTELDKLEYKPDAFPGARDVDTPYGSIRVYEWGPESGPKVFMIHGISTSCQTLTKLAHSLVESGCRVMLFDLFGRGFSDTPTDLPHDARLYVTQSLLALSSSPLSWTGSQARLRVIGYSMGGGVAVHLASSFPETVDSLLLLAPAGLIRPQKFGLLTRLVFRSGLVPGPVLAELTRRRLEKPIASGVRRKGPGGGEKERREPLLKQKRPDGLTSALAEAADVDPVSNELEPPSDRLASSVLRYVQWMVEHHPGFVPAFMSCIRHAPLMDQQEAYRGLAERKVRTAFLFGREDLVVDEGDYREDAVPLFGDEEVFWRVVGGGHDFVMTHAEEALKEMREFWGM